MRIIDIRLRLKTLKLTLQFNIMDIDNRSNEIKELPTGAKRQEGVAGSNQARYDLLPPAALRRWAEAFGEGVAKYGEDNWLKGFNARGLVNHALAHILKYMSGDRSEDHLGHAMWNIGALIHFEETRPDLMDLPDYEGAKLKETEAVPWKVPCTEYRPGHPLGRCIVCRHTEAAHSNDGVAQKLNEILTIPDEGHFIVGNQFAVHHLSKVCGSFKNNGTDARYCAYCGWSRNSHA